MWKIVKSAKPLGQINDDHDDDGETGKKRRQNLKTWKIIRRMIRRRKEMENLTAILKMILITLIKQMMVSDKR